MKTYNEAEVSRFPSLAGQTFVNVWPTRLQVPLVPVLRMMMMYRYQRMGLTHWNSCCLASANLGEAVEDLFFLYEKFAYIWVG